METLNKKPIKVVVVSKVPAYATTLGILSIIAAVISLFIPGFGIIFITPLAIIFGIFALWGGAKALGIASFCISVVKIVISPLFWINALIGFGEPGIGINGILSYSVILGMIIMVILFFKKSKSS